MKVPILTELRGTLRQILDHVPVALIEWAAGTAIAFVVTYGSRLFEATTGRLLVSLVEGLVVPAIVGWGEFRLSEQRRLEQERNTVEGEKENYRIEAADLRQQAERREALIKSYRAIFGRENLSPLPGLEGKYRYLCLLQRRHLCDIEKFSELIEYGSADATYEQQLELATALAGSAAERLWTTCCDKLSDFHGRNYYYLKSLKPVGLKFSGRADETPTPAGRIFVATASQFADEIKKNYPKVVELYGWHVGWLRRVPGIGKDFPVKFLCANQDEYEKLFEKYQILPEQFIEDFMVVDNSFVYGRRTPLAGDLVRLGLIEDPDVVRRYAELYKELWRLAYGRGGWIQAMRRADPAQERTLDDLAALLSTHESRVGCETDFGHVVPETQRKGQAFFDWFLGQIQGARGKCIAIDQAHLKTGALIKSWRERREYKEFLDASKAAASGGADFRRLFIIQGKVQEPEEDIRAFISDSVSSRVQVGFLRSSELSRKLDVGEVKQRYGSDFIVVSPAVGAFDSSTAIGFELEEAGFVVDNLSWDRNLIPRSKILERIDYFEKLWTPALIIAGTDELSINAAVARLAKGE
jgi:hypothetical protein